MKTEEDTIRSHAGERLGTRLSFFVAGFAIACWAPLVPFAKEGVGADDAGLGLILLCLGIGSLVAMPLTGVLSARLGSKPMIVAGGVGLALLLPFLPIVGEAWLLALVLLGFGASLGTLDVAMNIHAVEVDSHAERSLMSGFHAMYSAGGIVGAGVMSALLSMGTSPGSGALLCAVVALLAILMAWPRLRPARGEPTPLVAPRGFVLLLSFLCAVCFLVEGAVLDWSALLMIGRKLASAEEGGLGFMVFSVAMTVGRLTGDRIVSRYGNFRPMFWGGCLTIVGIAVTLTAPAAPVALAGFLLIGLGAANIVPILFRMVGRQTAMPVPLAVAALTTTGYAGILLGPALIGFVSQQLGLVTAFWLLAVLMAAVPVLAKRATRR